MNYNKTHFYYPLASTEPDLVSHKWQQILWSSVPTSEFWLFHVLMLWPLSYFTGQSAAIVIRFLNKPSLCSVINKVWSFQTPETNVFISSTEYYIWGKEDFHPLPIPESLLSTWERNRIFLYSEKIQVWRIMRKQEPQSDCPQHSFSLCS